jgi:hypothetical protein
MMFVLPLLILERDFFPGFWRSTWFLIPMILAVLTVIDLYFLSNYRVYTLLEKEDWPALIQELERKVLQTGYYSPRLVSLLINTYLVLSDTVSVTELEKRLFIAKRKLVNRNALSFGVARILQKDYQGAVEFFAPRISGKKSNDWLRWYYGFSLLLSRRFEEAADALVVSILESREAVLTGLSAYFLEENLAAFLPRRRAELKEAAEKGKERVKKSLRKREDWNREIKRMETEVYAAVLQSYLGKTAEYLYKA